MAFCQYGGHDSLKPRGGGNLTTITWPDNHTNVTLCWLVCDECKNKFKGTDLTMEIFLLWANEVSSVRQLPASLRCNPLKQALLGQYIDKFLNRNIRIKFGNRFPFFLIDICENEKKYFLLELTQQRVISDIFLTDIQNMDESTSISLKLWVGATMAAKGTRATFNISGGHQSYTTTERIQAFKAIDKLASNDEIVRTGAEVTPVVELLVRSPDFISLEGCDSDSPIRKYVKKDAVLQYITSNDLVIKIDKSSD
ncbi:MAG: hypothetical protein WAM14_26540 [Candidatus Nitrosopolaris sp.]